MKKTSLVIILSLVPNTIDESSYSYRDVQPESKTNSALTLARPEKIFTPEPLVLPLEYPTPFPIREPPYQPSLSPRKETQLERNEEERIWNEIILPAWEKALYYLEQEGR